MLIHRSDFCILPRHHMELVRGLRLRRTHNRPIFPPNFTVDVLRMCIHDNGDAEFLRDIVKKELVLLCYRADLTCFHGFQLDQLDVLWCLWSTYCGTSDFVKIIYQKDWNPNPERGVDLRYAKFSYRGEAWTGAKRPYFTADKMRDFVKCSLPQFTHEHF